MRRTMQERSGRRIAVAVSALAVVLLTVMVFSCATAEDDNSIEAEGRALELKRVQFVGMRAHAVTPGKHVFTSQAEWKAFWSDHHSAPAPEIDFENYILLTVFLGQKPNPGYGVEFIGAREYEREVVVEILERLPSPDAAYVQVIVYPCDVALMPKTDKSVHFETSKKGMDLRPHLK